MDLAPRRRSRGHPGRAVLSGGGAGVQGRVEADLDETTIPRGKADRVEWVDFSGVPVLQTVVGFNHRKLFEHLVTGCGGFTCWVNRPTCVTVGRMGQDDQWSPATGG